MKVEVLLMEREIAHEFAESLAARDLPEKFFYWSAAATANWLMLLQEPWYDDLRELWKHTAERAPSVAGHLEGPVSVISFGAGSGWSDRLFMAALLKAGRELRYFPVDASQILLEQACDGGEDDDIDTLGIKADVSSPTHLVLAADAAEGGKVFLMSGNTLGSFDPLDQIRHVAECMSPQDRLVVDAMLYSPDLAAALDTPAHRRFAFGPLATIGVGEDDGEVKFEWKTDERHSGLWLLTRRFKAERDLVLHGGGPQVELARGERIYLNFEYLYSAEAFQWVVEARGKLNVRERIMSPDGRFAAWICSR
jgi:uncharacterized SAM-dependent methyltransferase